MSKMGKFFAARRGQSSVKASADAALQTILALEEPSDAPLMEAIAVNEKPHADEWGVEDSETDVIPVGSSTVVGGHLLLISEEDVSKKLNRKGPKKWGEVKKPVADVADASGAVQQKDTPEAADRNLSATQSGVALYRPPRVATRATAKIDVESHQLFPDFEAAEFKAPSHGPSTSSKKKIAVEDKLTKNDSSNRRRSSTTAKPTSDEQETSTTAITVMAIEEFLKDVVVPELNVAFNDDMSRQKFIGRKKRPTFVIPVEEVSG